jgi:glycosyltransferase involved in cell wall biosynthesis
MNAIALYALTSKLKVGFALKLITKLVSAQFSRTRFNSTEDDQPCVTVFIASLNTKWPLILTIESLAKRTRYENYRIIVGDSGSTDGTVEWLQRAAGRLRLDVRLAKQPMQHSDWLNWMWQHAETDYWCAVDSDMWFLQADWLGDMVSHVTANPQAAILSAEPKCAANAVREPVGGLLVDQAETPCTWLFMVRTSVRSKISRPDFRFVNAGVRKNSRRPLLYDTGGQLLQECLDAGFLHAIMPRWFQRKYHHFGSLTWIESHLASSNGFAKFKHWQRSFIQKMCQKENNAQ